MAGSFKALFFQDFTSTDTITVTHNQNLFQLGVRVIVGGEVRQDLIESIAFSTSDPRNELTVKLTSAQTGVVQIVNNDLSWANFPTPANAAKISDNALEPDVGGDLTGSIPNPSVVALTEASGPTQLVLGTIADGQVLTRSGSTIVGTAGGGGGISGPGSSIDRGVVVWDGTGGTAVLDSGVRNYGVSATDPTSPTPADGDFYINSVLDMGMIYDATRAKWLSIETVEIPFNRNGNTGGGAYYRMGQRAMSATLGRTAEWNGTVVSISYTRSDTDSATFEVLADGTTSLATLASTAGSGSTVTANGDFSQGDVLSVKNQTGSNVTRNVIGFVRLKWRAT